MRILVLTKEKEQKLFEKLTPFEQLAVRMLENHSLTYKEIAYELNVSEITIKRLFQKIKKEIENDL